MAKYEVLIAASGKRGSALLPCVVIDEKGITGAAEFPRLSTSIGVRKGSKKMNLIREVISDQTVTALASIALIVAALPMAGWSWAVNQMAGRKKEGT